jgi:hypothetical protein
MLIFFCEKYKKDVDVWLLEKCQKWIDVKDSHMSFTISTLPVLSCTIDSALIYTMVVKI